jgi:peptide deformylase
MKIIKFDDKLLLEKSELITDINGGINELVFNMFEAMYAGNGIGLAAVQVGVLKRIFVMDVPDYGKHVLINPVVIDKSLDTNTHEEGCLSIPGISASVARPKEVVLEYIDLDGKKKKLKAKGLLAVCAQHEFDHLEGILFVDRLKSEERLEKIKEYRKLTVY